jgi:hypothetical protein
MRAFISALYVAVSLTGCKSEKQRKSENHLGSDESQGRTTPTKDPDLVFDPSKTSCKSICSGIEGCPVKQAHCKKEVEPPVCWALYYTSDYRTDWCFFRKDPLNCPEQFPVYCDAESGLVLPEFRPPTTTTAAKKKLTSV